MYVQFLTFVAILLFLANITAAQFEDLRCKCICLSYPKYDLPAQVYTAGVLSSNCECLDVVVPVLNGTIVKKSDLEPYCLRCDCKYEVRSTKTMQVIVCIYLVLIGTLVCYMVFMLVIDPILAYIKKSKGYSSSNLASSTHRENLQQPHTSNRTNRTPSSSVFEKMNLVQSRWKRQVEEQRSNVFERQEMLQ